MPTNVFPLENPVDKLNRVNRAKFRSDILEYLKSIRKKLAATRELIEYVEGKRIEELCPHTTEQNEFYKAYLLALLKEYCSNSDVREIIELDFGLLSGYEDYKTLKEARTAYTKTLGKNLSETSLRNSFSRREDSRFFVEIAKDITDSVKANGSTGLLIKMHLPFKAPEPLYSRNSPIWGSDLLKTSSPIEVLGEEVLDVPVADEEEKESIVVPVVDEEEETLGVPVVDEEEEEEPLGVPVVDEEEEEPLGVPVVEEEEEEPLGVPVNDERELYRKRNVPNTSDKGYSKKRSIFHNRRSK